MGANLLGHPPRSRGDPGGRPCPGGSPTTFPTGSTLGVGSVVLVAARAVRLGGPTRGVVLKLSGVGFKCFVTPGGATLGLGYSHYVGITLPVGVITRPGRGHLAVGPTRGDLSGRVRRLRVPDPYKSRGIYPAGEVPPRKEGKRR